MNACLVPSAFPPLFVNFCDFKNSQDFEIMKIRKVKPQLLCHKTMQILALTSGKRESQPIFSYKHDKNFYGMPATTRLVHPIWQPFDFLSLARAPLQNFTFHNCVIKTKTKKRKVTPQDYVILNTKSKYLLATLRDFISDSVSEMIT